jgi:hypothetical protein
MSSTALSVIVSADISVLSPSPADILSIAITWHFLVCLFYFREVLFTVLHGTLFWMVSGWCDFCAQIVWILSEFGQRLVSESAPS